MTASRDPHRSIGQEEEEGLHSRTLAEEERLDRSHMVEPGHSHIGVHSHFVEDTVHLKDTVHLEDPENLAATARTWDPVGGWVGKPAVRTDSVAEIVDHAGSTDRILGEVKAVVTDEAMGDQILEP